VDLYSGAGGCSLAARNVGCEIVFAVENDKYAAATYRSNFCHEDSRQPTTLYDQSILDLSATDLKRKHFSGKRRCDILLGGPPCQGFSSHRINDSGVNDPRNSLIHSYFEFVRVLKPRIFLMENVPGILWSRHEEYLSKFYHQARSAGYNVFEPIKIDAKNYGVPQRRQRVFILGVEQGIGTEEFVWPPFPTHGPGNDLKAWCTCEQVFAKTSKDDPNDIHMNHGAELVRAFKNTPINGGSRKDSGRVLPCHKNHDGHKDVYGRINPFKPAPTMTTACINPSKGRFVHPTLHHGITARQAARIQTFPDDFVFHGGLTAAGKQIGNAVPVKLGEVLIQSIAELLVPNKRISPIAVRQQEDELV